MDTMSRAQRGCAIPLEAMTASRQAWNMLLEGAPPMSVPRHTLTPASTARRTGITAFAKYMLLHHYHHDIVR